ncbi:MAG: signal recognition particle-docking protein FtsY, partial [Mesorhizobium sp.]
AGFFKKIFSFGKKEVVEERPDEAAPLPPIKWDELEALKPAAEQAVPEFLKREEPRPEADTAPPSSVDTEAPPAPQPQLQPAPTIPPEPEIQPEPALIEEPEAPAEESASEEIPSAPVIPEPEPTQPEIVQSSERGAAPHPPAGTFSPYIDGGKGAD